MNLLDVIMNAQGGDAVRRAGAQVGLGEAETTTALPALVPALAAGFQRYARTPDGPSSLVAATAGAGSGGLLDLLTPLVDQYPDGSMMD